MKNFKSIQISNPAKKDLNNISEYTLKNWGKLQKKIYLGLIKQSFVLLSQESIKITPLVKSRKDIDAGLFSYRVKKHVIYYRVSEQSILIIRILHTQMDPDKHLTKI